MSDLELETVISNLEDGKVLQASGEIMDRSGLMPKTVYVEWYVVKIDDIYVAVNHQNAAEALGCEAEFGTLVADTGYEVTKIIDIEEAPYKKVDFQEMLERNTCDCEEPIAFRPEHSLWTCSLCNKPLKDQDREGEDDERSNQV